MIEPVSSQTIYQGLRVPPGGDDLPASSLAGSGPAGLSDALRPDGAPRTGSFGELVSSLVRSVDDKGKAADAEVRRLMLGESDNIHRSMIAMQEAGLAFNLLVEVRNKLVESYQELMRMPV